MTIGERIKQRRIELGLTQTELAHRMGLTSKTTICKAETTDFNPTTDRVREFAKALECSPAYLMGWESREGADQANTYQALKELADKKLAIEELESSGFSHEQIASAIKLYEKYKNASPEVQAIVELALKSAQQKP